MATQRLTGLMSGMDTESLISQLMEARRAKVDKKTKAQTKLSWKQEAWKDLNTKIKNLQSKFVSNMRFTSSYAKKTTKVSNSSAVSVITGQDAVDGVQELEVNQLAKTGYLTGAKLNADGKNKTALSSMKDLGFTGQGSITLNNNGKDVTIDINEDTTISSVLTQMKNAGLNASFDVKQQRFFISAKKSGASNDFSLNAKDSGGLDALTKLGLREDISSQSALDADKQSASYKAYAKTASYAGATDADTLSNLVSDGLIDKAVSESKESYLKQYESLVAKRDEQQSKIDELTEKIAGLEDGDEKVAAQEQLDKLNSSISDTISKIDDIAGDDGYITVTVSTDDEGNIVYSATTTSKLESKVGEEQVAIVNTAKDAISGTGTTGYATKVSGQDARITLNGAEFTSNDNVFEINGLTFTALSETKPGETVTVTTAQDTDGIYDMIKNFLKEYNSLINEMDKLYNAESAKGFEPLSDEEKEAMSESEIEKYETKIKDALLKGDENLSSVSSAIKAVMSSGITLGGKTMYLSDFGINTLGYFNAADNEKYALHIDGDEDDEHTSGNADKLKSMIASDPNSVINFFAKLSQTLYDKMSNMSKSVAGTRTFGSFYDDKKMKSDYDDYTTKIKDMEDKLNAYEDKWYKKFSKMETAMAKMQKNVNAVTAMTGGQY